MGRHASKQIKTYQNKVLGEKVSDYGLEMGYLDYYTLSKIVGDSILNNNIFEKVGYENWELISGVDVNEYYGLVEIFQYYIITEAGAKFLDQLTDEIIYYNEDLDMYLWGVTHLGTSWDYVLTDIELVKGDD